MSPVGHSLVGLALAGVALGSTESRKWRIGLPIVFVALANLPDWPIPNWGHDRYEISHSVFVNGLLLSLSFCAYCLMTKRNTMKDLWCIGLGGCAWLSHLLLDSFYDHGNGVAIYWPFSSGRLNFSLPWFHTLDLSQSIVSVHNLKVFGTEFVVYMPVLLFGLAVGRMISRYSKVSEATVTKS